MAKKIIRKKQVIMFINGKKRSKEGPLAKKTFLLCWLLFFISLTAFFADDASYEGDGIDVYPLQNTDIQLVSEIITITGEENRLKGWNIYVDMTFKNHGDDTSVQMGFPLFSAYNPDNDNEEYDYHFQTYVNEEKVVVTKKHGVPNPLKNLEHFSERVFTYPVSFKRMETKRIVHSYRVGGYSSFLMDWNLKYILRTGALWKGPIENLKIFYKTNVDSAKYITGITPSEHESQVKGKELILKWEFENYKPQTDLSISGIFFIPGEPNPIMNNIVSPNSHKRRVMQSSPISLRYTRNRVFASYGYPFKSPLIAAQFYYPGSPYKENPGFTMEKITKEDRLFIDYLFKIEKWQAALEKKRIQWVLDYEHEGESSPAKFESNLIESVALDRNSNTMIYFEDRGHLLFLGYPDCIPQKRINLSSHLPTKYKNVSWYISESPPALSCDGRYFATTFSYYAEGFEDRKPVIVIIDVVNRWLLHMIPSESLGFYSPVRFSKDSSGLLTFEAAYDVRSGKKIKEWTFPENIDLTTLKLLGVTPGDNILFTSQTDNKIYSLDIASGQFTGTEIVVKTMASREGESIRLSDLTMSIDGKYLAGSVMCVKGKQWSSGTAREERLAIWKASGGSYTLLYDQLIEHFPGKRWLVWLKEKPYLFMAISSNLWRFRLSSGDEVEAVKIPLEGIQSSLLKLNRFSIFADGRFWDIETGKKFWPWYEVLDPFDTTNQLPLYDAKPSPVHLRSFWENP